MSRPSTPRPRRDDRMPPFLGMLGALVVGGIVGAFGGLWAGARLAPLLGLSESAGTAALFVTFAALPPASADVSRLCFRSVSINSK